MADMVVRNGVRMSRRDANRVDVVSAADAVQVKVLIPDTDAWALAQAEAARAELQAELDATRARAAAELETELAQRRADFEKEIEARREAADSTAVSAEVASVVDPAGVEPTEVVADAAARSDDEEKTTKVVDPEVTKVREPDVTKRRGRPAPVEK
jgi:hypothetical protein